MITSILSSCWRSSIYALLGAFGTLGILAAILIPPFQVPDEPVHWTAAYSRTILGKSNSKTSQATCSLANGLVGVFEPGRIAFRPGEKVAGRQYKAALSMQPGCIPDTLNYGLVTTYPGVVLARALTTGEENFPHKAFQVFLLGRLLQGVLVLALAWRLLSVSFRSGRLIPGTLVMTAIMCAPLFVQQSFAISADTVTFALPLSLLFFLFHMPRARWFDWTGLIALAITVAATKPPLFALVPAFLYVALARARVELGEKRWITSLSWPSARLVHLCVVLAFAAALWISSQQPVTAGGQPGGGGGHVQQQLRYILSNPLTALVMLLDVTWAKFTSWEPFVGSLGWLDTHLSGWTQTKYQQLFFAALGVDAVFALCGLLHAGTRKSVVSALRWKIPTNIALTLCLFGVGLCTSFILYITWTPIGADGVAGLQARYFLPMLLPFPLLVGDLLVGHPAKEIAPYGGSRIGSIAGICIFGTLALLLFFPLYLDLILRWW